MSTFKQRTFGGLPDHVYEYVTKLEAKLETMEYAVRNELTSLARTFDEYDSPAGAAAVRSSLAAILAIAQQQKEREE